MQKIEVVERQLDFNKVPDLVDHRLDFDYDEVPTTNQNFLAQNRGKFVRWSKIKGIIKEKEFTYLTSGDRQYFERSFELNDFTFWCLHKKDRDMFYLNNELDTRNIYHVNDNNVMYDYLIKDFTTNGKTSIKCMMQTPKIRQNVCVLTPCDDTWVFIGAGVFFQNVNITSFQNVFETELGKYYLHQFPSFLEFAPENVKKELEEQMIQRKKEILQNYVLKYRESEIDQISCEILEQIYFSLEWLFKNDLFHFGDFCKQNGLYEISFLCVKQIYREYFLTKRECGVCTETKNCNKMPCGHDMCVECLGEIVKRGCICPWCRKKMTYLVHVV